MADAVIFSVENGFVFAYLPGKSAPVALGETGTVTYMMRDFLAQCDLVERLGLPG